MRKERRVLKILKQVFYRTISTKYGTLYRIVNSLNIVPTDLNSHSEIRSVRGSFFVRCLTSPRTEVEKGITGAYEHGGRGNR